MKKLIIYLLLACPPCTLLGQIGIKAGINFANATNASSINSSNRTGWHAGIIMGSPTKKIIGFRSELTYSNQGYDYQSGVVTGSVDLNYIMSSHLTTINITRFLQLQAGFQLAYLLNAKADSSKNSNGSMPYSNIMNIYNRFDYGLGGGVEIAPAGGLILGARLNISLANLYKDVQSSQMPSFSTESLKTNVLQIYAGWRFGKQEKKNK